MDFASKEEEYFYWFLLELQSLGFIKKIIYQPKGFVLSQPLVVEFAEQKKTKQVKKSVTLLQEHEYRADFLFYWDERLKHKMYADYNEILNKSIKKYPFVVNHSAEKDIYFSVVDVKGTYNQNDAWRRFSIDQKWVFQNFGIYIQKIIPAPDSKGYPKSALFSSVFMPKRYQITDKSGKKRKLSFKPILIDQWMQENNIV